MNRPSQVDAYRLTLMVDAGDRFRDLAPYVASIDSRGRVAFQAGGGGVFTVADRATAAVVDAQGPFEHFRGVLVNKRTLINVTVPSLLNQHYRYPIADIQEEGHRRGAARSGGTG